MYILSIDQSTQGTKALLFDETGEMVARADHPHRQIITKEGWVEHDLKEILCNVYQVCREVVEKLDRDVLGGEKELYDLHMIQLQKRAKNPSQAFLSWKTAHFPVE